MARTRPHGRSPTAAGARPPRAPTPGSARGPTQRQPSAPPRGAKHLGKWSPLVAVGAERRRGKPNVELHFPGSSAPGLSEVVDKPSGTNQMDLSPEGRDHQPPCKGLISWPGQQRADPHLPPGREELGVEPKVAWRSAHMGSEAPCPELKASHRLHVQDNYFEDIKSLAEAPPPPDHPPTHPNRCSHGLGTRPSSFCTLSRRLTLRTHPRARPARPAERGGSGAGLHIPACRPRPGARRGSVSQSRTVNICISRSRLANGGRVRRRRAPWREAGAGRRRRRHVREHGRAQAPGHDQPVRTDGRLCGRPGEAVAAGGPLAVRDGPQRLFPRDQHPVQPPSPPDDVHSCQHPRHAPQLPRCPHHVLPPQGLRELPQRRQRQPDGRHGHIAAAALPAHRHRQLRGAQLASRGLTPRGRTAPSAAAAAPVDSGPHFPGVRLAAPGPPTGHLGTQGPPRHGGREIREAPPPSRRPGPRGAGERTSLRAPFTLLCLHPFSPEPWRGETGPSSQPTGCPHACPAAQACGAPLPWIWFRVTWVLMDKSSENKQPSPEDSPTLPRRPRGQRSIATPETGRAPALELPGAGGPRSPPSGTQSLLRMCACSCVCVFIRMSLFEKQPSLWGSWTLHVRVSPPRPPPFPPGPCPSLLLPGQPALLFPAEKRIVGNSRTLPTHPPAPACWGCLHASPEPGGTPSPIPFPLLTKEKKEFQTTTRLCGRASYPKLCCQLAPCGGGGCQPSPEQRPTPESCLAPHCCYLSLSFQPQRALESSCPPQAFPMKLVPALCSQNPCLCLLTLPPVQLDRSRPPGLTAAFRSAWVSHKDFSCYL